MIWRITAAAMQGLSIDSFEVSVQSAISELSAAEQRTCIRLAKSIVNLNKLESDASPICLRDLNYPTAKAT